MKNKKILIRTGFGVLAVIAIVAAVLISGCVEEKPMSTKEELLNLLSMPPEENYNASYIYSAGGSGAYTNIKGEIVVVNGEVKYYKYVSSNRATNTLKEYSSDKGWLNCKDAPGAGPTMRTKTIYLNCSNEYKELTEEALKKTLIQSVSAAANTSKFYDIGSNLVCFNVDMEFMHNSRSYGDKFICFDVKGRFVKWYIRYYRGIQRWIKTT